MATRAQAFEIDGLGAGACGPAGQLVTFPHGTALRRIWGSDLAGDSRDDRIDDHHQDSDEDLDDCGSTGQSCMVMEEDFEPGVQLHILILLNMYIVIIQCTNLC